MKSKIVARVVPVAIALLVIIVALAVAREPTGPVTTAERQQAELEIARSGITSRLEATLGDDFGGIWMEPSRAQLHVGVPSAESRRNAESTASRVGVAGIVVETPVRSTWAELKTAQQRWAQRMADLFDRAEVVTAPRAQYNALEVELGSAVPNSRRAALERAAALDDVNVLVRMGESTHFRVEKQARCASFSQDKAKCDPTMVAGVTIVNEAKTGLCTAGPVVMPRSAANAALATERLILTSGHCIDPNGNKKWFAYEKKSGTLEPVGPGGSFVNNHVADIGVIEIEPTSIWRQAGFTPVNPTISMWDSKAENTPIPVIGEREPFEGAETCISGSSSGKKCGKVLAVGKTFKGSSTMTEVNVTVETGDSGAPWYAQQYAEAGGGLIEGVHSARNEANAFAIFEPLKYGLEKLKAEKGADYVLVTTGNEERRHPVATADKYPATASAKGSSEDVFTAFGATLKCTESEYDGVLTGASSSIELTPAYKGCTALGLPATFTSNSCKYKFSPKEETGEGQFSSQLDVSCPAEKAGLQFDVYAGGTLMCTLTAPPQTGLKSGTLKNSGSNLVLEKATIEAVKMKVHRNNVFCPLGSGTVTETSSGVYDFNKAVTLSGTSGGEGVKIDIGGA